LRSLKSRQKWGGVEKSKLTSVSEFRQIGIQESRRQVSRHHDHRNRNRENPEGKEERSALTISGFGDSRDQRLTTGFTKLQSLISQEKRGDPVRVRCGYRFPDREIEEHLEFFRLVVKERSCVDVDLLTCRLWREHALASSLVSELRKVLCFL
jgi:hypothetical protein